MKASDTLTLSQLAQRIDELQGLKDKIQNEILDKRFTELTTQFENRSKSNFNKGIVTPVPADHIDIDNSSVITPKSPQQVDREYNAWEKSLS